MAVYCVFVFRHAFYTPFSFHTSPLLTPPHLLTPPPPHQAVTYGTSYTTEPGREVRKHPLYGCTLVPLYPCTVVPGNQYGRPKVLLRPERGGGGEEFKTVLL